MKANWLTLLTLWIMGVVTTTEGRRARGRQRNIPSPSGDRTYDTMCPPCQLSHCPVVTTDMCRGSIVKDWCNCCPICIGSSEADRIRHLTTPITTTTSAIFVNEHIPATFKETDQSEACEKIECSKFEVCMLNIQGIPMCRCPTKFWCMKGERSPVCGQDDVTYKSKCFLKMAECERATHIPIKNRGKCFKSENDRKLKLERQRQKELKEQQRAEKKKMKMEKMKKLKKKDKKDKKESRKQRRKQRRRSKNKRWTNRRQEQ